MKQGDLENIIAVRNRELVALALEACMYLFGGFTVSTTLLTYTSRLQKQYLLPGRNT
jgi:hypothetical protein